MGTTVGVLNLILGAVYTAYGILTIADMRRGWRTLGFSHFGMAWIFMAFTCGPHHLVHGAHIVFEGRAGAPLDLVAVLVGFPAGVVWFLLRVEALTGGRGDRFVPGTPAWVEILPTLGGAYAVWLAGSALGVGALGLVSDPGIAPNLVLIVLYGAIGAVLLRTQLANRVASGGWSLSGLALTVVFPTCGLMHGAYALYVSAGRYDADVHGIWIDTLAVPAAAYFLWVVWSIASGRIRDWTSAAGDSTPHRDRTADLDAPVRVGVR